MVRTLLCLLIFFLSSLGYWDFLRRNTVISVCFLPVFTVATEFCILFLAGCLNLLVEGAVLLYAGGILLLVDRFRKEKLLMIRPYLQWSYLFFFCLLAVWILAVPGKTLSVEDDFAHWGIVVKKMLETNRLPNFTDEVIGFQKYPLGSSLWIWFFCFLLGGQEDFMLLAQGYLLLCCLLPWWHGASRNKPLCALLIFLGLCVILNYNIGVNHLMVDLLLPLAGMASFYFIFMHGKAFPQSLIWAIPLLVWTAQIKNSGLLFALAGSVLLLVIGTQDRKWLPLRLICASSPAIGFLLWSRHCDLVFTDSAFSKHAISAESYSANLGQKTMEEIGSILSRITEYVVSRDGFLLTVFYLALLGVVTFLLLRSLKKEYLKLCLVCGCLMVVYYMGICGMYLFSMPTKEAMMLAAIERYMRTLDIAILYLLMVYSLHLLSAAEKPVAIGLCCTVVCCFWLSLFHVGFFHTLFSRNENPERRIFNEVLEEYGVQPGARYMICLKGYPDYYWFLCRYTLDATPLCLEVESPEQMDAAADYDVLINFDVENSVIAQWVADHYPNFQGQQVVYMYD